MRRLVRLGLAAAVLIAALIAVGPVLFQPVGHRLATIPTAVTWITDLTQTGPFGTHIQAYRLAPEAYVGRVADFLDGVLRPAATLAPQRAHDR